MLKPNLATKERVSLYIHWPFCVKKCPYCDFNSHVSKVVDHQKWSNAYLRALAAYDNYLSEREISTVFFGGGTPSLMEPSTVEAILNYLVKNHKLSANTEITLEANPSSVENAKLINFKEAGINRVSLGTQSFNDHNLKFLGRVHSAASAMQALEIISNLFNNFSFDLIYALPEQNLLDWQTELELALSFRSPHLSLYQLTIEKGTKFYQDFLQGKLKVFDPDLAYEFHHLTSELTSKAGLVNYEVSNYAKPGYQSRHNLAYWNYQEYLGIGPGAHSRVMLNNKLHALIAWHNPDKWLANPADSQQDSVLSSQEIIHEILLMGLRLREGFAINIFPKLLSKKIEECINQSIYEHFLEIGILKLSKGNLRLSQDYYLTHNEVITQLTANK